MGYVQMLTSAIAATAPAEASLVMNQGQVPGRQVVSFDSLLATAPGASGEAAHARVGPDTIAKFLFTSGSTKLPKAVINTHGMLTANQQQMALSMPVLTHKPLVLIDWLPWNHTFGGNHNFGMVMYHGGTLYIDDGKPTPALMGETLRNLREIAPTVYFNVPTGFEAIAQAMTTDAVLRQKLLSRVHMFFYAGAALAQPVWDSLYASAEKELAYMGLEAGKSLSDYNVDKVFVGSCTNSRIEDTRAAAEVAKGRKVASHVQALIVPGSEQVKAQAEAEGLDVIFKEARFEWRLPGCSMCLAMNNDRLGPHERCASTSNRNFEGRQGRDGRTHLVSPAMAAAAAIAGHFVDIRELD